MHLLIPFASALSEPAAEVVRDLPLPSLASLLQRLTAEDADETGERGARHAGGADDTDDASDAKDANDEYTLSPPHERALARAWGWPLSDGGLPLAAQAAAADGIAVGDQAWGLLTPTHWDVGRDHVTLSDPQALRLDEAESRALFDAVRGLFETEGFALAWGAPSRWYASHESLAGHRSASLDRVVGRNVDLWLRGAEPAGVSAKARTLAASSAAISARTATARTASEMTASAWTASADAAAASTSASTSATNSASTSPSTSPSFSASTSARAAASPAASTRLLRRLQSEVQLLLYPHPINEAREARGEMTVNSFWLSGCGRYRAADLAAVRVDESLRGPLVQQDWAAWAEAWRALDAGPLARLLAQLENDGGVTLTLCGERHARTFQKRPLPLLKRLRQRWSAPLPATVLEAL